MNLDSVKSTTLSVLSGTSEDEIAIVTLPVLREKVAEAMKVPIEELLGKEIKAVILETFQEFLLSKSSSNNEKESDGDEHKEDDDSVEEEPVPVKKAKTEKKPSKANNTVESKPVKSKKVEAKGASKVKKTDTVKSPSKPKASTSASTSSAKSVQIEKLKSYVFKCGVRKVWKKELEGLNESQSIAKIQGILRELGIEGKPSLEQCKAIKERREFEAELREIDASNIIEGKRRSSIKKIEDIAVVKKKNRVIESDTESENDGSDSDESEDSGIEIDLNAFGDSESD